MVQDNFNGRLAQNDSLKYALAVLEDETIYFKIKLTRILSNDFERSHLEQLEVFQHRFLKMDEQIGLLRHEAGELQEALKQVDKTTLEPEDVKKLRRTLEAKIDIIKDSFGILSADFNQYLRHFPGI